MRLTQKIVDAALYEGRSYTSKSGRKRWRQHVLADDALPGFGLRISSSNRKSFFVSYRADGRRRTRTLGTVDRMSLKKARLLAAERLAEAPPAADQGPLDDIETVAQLANAYLDKHLKPNSPSWFADQRLIRTHIKPAMGRSPIAQVSQNEIISLTSRVGRRFPADARRLRSLLKGMFDWAEERGLWSRSAGAAEAAGAQTATNGKTTTGVAKGKAPKKKRPAGERGAKPAAKASRKGSSKPTRRPSAKALADSLQRSKEEQRELATRLTKVSTSNEELSAKLEEQEAARVELEGELKRAKRALQRAETVKKSGPDPQKMARQTANLQESVEQLMASIRQTEGERDEATRKLAAAEARSGEQAKRVALLVSTRNELEDRLREHERTTALRRVQRRSSDGRRQLVVRLAAAAAAGALLTVLIQGVLIGGKPGAGETQVAGFFGAAPLAADPAVPEPDAKTDSVGVLEPAATEVAVPQPTATANAALDESVFSTAEPAVRSWAAAWSAQDIDDYLAAYSDRFEPPNGLGRSAWAAQRRQRILRPAEIRVTLGDFELRRIGSDRLRVVFEQSYWTPTYSDQVSKTLELVWEGRTWRILAERAS